MYFTGYITVIYLYLAVKKTIDNDGVAYELPTDKHLYRIFFNLLLTEIAATYAFWYVDMFSSFSFTNLVLFFLAQDVYFYTVHRLLHTYAYWIHAAHHEVYAPLFAWHGTFLDHILVNLMSIAVPFWLFPNTRFILLIIINIEVYTSITGHVHDAPHQIHHKHSNKRLGSIYLIDRLLGSF